MKESRFKNPLTLKRYLGRIFLIFFIGMPFFFLIPSLASIFLIREGINKRQNERIFYLQTYGDDYLQDRLRDLLLIIDILDTPGPEDSPLLYHFLKRHLRFYNLYLTDASGRVVCDAGTEYPLLGMDLSSDPLFSVVRKKRKPEISLTPISLTSRKSVLTMIVPILIKEDFMGVLFAELDLSKFQSKLITVTSDSAGLTFIVDKNGTLVIHPDFQWVQQQPNLAADPFIRHGFRHMGHSEIYKSTLAGFRAKPVWYIGSSRLMENGWMIITVEPLFQVIGPVLLQITISIIILVILFLIMLMILPRYTQQLVSPLEGMVKCINRLRSGEYRMEPAMVTGLYELDLLYLSFVNMSDAVYQRDRWLEERVKERTAELLASREKEAEANRAKSIFLANVSHELRTPLNAILGFSQVLWSAANLTDQQRENIDVIIRNGNRLLRLINEVIELSRLETHNVSISRDPVNIRKLTDEIFKLLKPASDDKGLTLISDIDSSVPGLFFTDQEKLQHILINLLDNGIKYTNQGSVILHCRFEHDLLIEVQDTGSGIPPDIRDNLFELFYRSVKSHDITGSGLGLPIVRQNLDVMGGSISVGDSLSGGALFRIRLPVEVPAAAEVNPVGSKSLFDGDTELLEKLKKNLRLGDIGGIHRLFKESGHPVPVWMNDLLDDYDFNRILIIINGGEKD